MDATPPDLAVTDLSCARGGVPVLSGVGFTVAAGQALILRGPNGAGKTTLLRTLAGLQPALQGRISLPPDAMVHAGHADAVKATLTVTENLTFWARVFGTGGIDAALDAMDLVALADRPGGQLSAGQRRRLGLARLWVSGRPVWLLDEPTVSLDAASVALFARGVAAHLGQGGLAVIATHADIGLSQAAVLDLTPFRARADVSADAFDAAFG